MNHRETPQAASRRKNAAWIFLPIGLFLLIAGISSANEPLLGGYFLIGGVGIGGIATIAAVQGLFSHPNLTLDNQGVRLDGWLLRQSNFNLGWDEIAKARVSIGAPRGRALWLVDKADKLKLIEETRFEGFQETIDFVEKKLAAKNILVEFMHLPLPASKT